MPGSSRPRSGRPGRRPRRPAGRAGVAVEVGVDGDAADAEVAARPDDPHRDLAPVGDQDLRGAHLWFTGMPGDGARTSATGRGRPWRAPGSPTFAGWRRPDPPTPTPWRWPGTGCPRAWSWWPTTRRPGGAATTEPGWRPRVGRCWSRCSSAPSPVASAATMATAVAMAEAVEEVAGVTPGLKWPNDLVVAGEGGERKLAGILAEADWPAAPRSRRLAPAVGARTGGDRGRRRPQRVLARGRRGDPRRGRHGRGPQLGDVRADRSRGPARRLPPAARAQLRRAGDRRSRERRWTSGAGGRRPWAGGSGSISAWTTSRARPWTSPPRATWSWRPPGPAPDVRGRRRRPPRAAGQGDALRRARLAGAHLLGARWMGAGPLYPQTEVKGGMGRPRRGPATPGRQRRTRPGGGGAAWTARGGRQPGWRGQVDPRPRWNARPGAGPSPLPTSMATCPGHPAARAWSTTAAVGATCGYPIKLVETGSRPGPGHGVPAPGRQPGRPPGHDPHRVVVRDRGPRRDSRGSRPPAAPRSASRVQVPGLEVGDGVDGRLATGPSMPGSSRPSSMRSGWTSRVEDVSSTSSASGSAAMGTLSSSASGSSSSSSAGSRRPGSRPGAGGRGAVPAPRTRWCRCPRTGCPRGWA